MASTYRYDLLDDSFVDLWVFKHNDLEEDFPVDWSSNSLVLNKKAEPYHKSASVLKNNHPLMIMLEEEKLVRTFYDILNIKLTTLTFIHTNIFQRTF